MPNVIVQYRVDVLSGTGGIVLWHLKDAIRERASTALTGSELELTQKDFSFMFFKEGPDDELIEDMQVIILAHSFEERVRVVDELAELIGQAVDEVLSNTKYLPPRRVTYSVSVFLGGMGYYADGVMSS